KSATFRTADVVGIDTLVKVAKVLRIIVRMMKQDLPFKSLTGLSNSLPIIGWEIKQDKVFSRKQNRKLVKRFLR
ncbi:hypothetical protein, partial [Klebsiella pneumoniae]|uniref:hypothetical protein n=1 Tax=Klebsiella pneumoniae TaxID=573 RepID=UPI00385474E8